MVNPRGRIDYEIRRATPADADEIAAAHRESIRSIGARFYPADIVDDWAARLSCNLYVRAMEQGEAFYIAVGVVDGQRAVLGFASHRVLDDQHRTAVYVRSAAGRRGIGSALFRLAEADAIAAGAASIHVDASLAAVEFYRANGFYEVNRGEHQLWSGRRMPCVFMQKDLRSQALGSGL
jgi:putative acetyltransferase